MKKEMPSFSSIALIALLLTSLGSNSNTVAQSDENGQCGSNLLPLAPCAPFVQGIASSPAKPCCDNVEQIYIQQPSCLCVLLNETSSSPVPINTTLARQLPLLCNLETDVSTCAATPLPSTSPTSQVPSGQKPNSTVAASPVVTVAPKPSIMGFGPHHNAGANVNAKGQMMVMMLLIAISSVFTCTIS